MMTDGASPEISLRLLEIFGAMMRAETTMEAAEALGVSQPAVSAALRQLETQLGITLFERTHRRLVPTAEARALYTEIRPMFSMMRGFRQRARDIRQGKSGRLRIISTPPLGDTLAPRALRSFLAARPEVSVAYDVRRLENVMEAIQNGTADLGLALWMNRHPVVNIDVLHRDRMMAMIPKESALAAQAQISAQDIAAIPFVGLDTNSNLGMLLHLAFEQSRVSYLPRVEVRYSSTAAELANEGIGAAVVDPYTAAFHAAPHMVTRPFVPSCAVSAVLITRKGVPHSPLVNSFMAELRPLFTEFRQLQG